MYMSRLERNHNLRPQAAFENEQAIIAVHGAYKELALSDLLPHIFWSTGRLRRKILHSAPALMSMNTP
jgi:hypothetical protein